MLASSPGMLGGIWRVTAGSFRRGIAFPLPGSGSARPPAGVKWVDSTHRPRLRVSLCMRARPKAELEVGAPPSGGQNLRSTDWPDRSADFPSQLTTGTQHEGSIWSSSDGCGTASG